MMINTLLSGALQSDLFWLALGSLGRSCVRRAVRHAGGTRAELRQLPSHAVS